mmetsp:Transcript_14237/g.36399  ORF Transcript_14237/g.36399 Transcript_14237/m.36399 type:complete len:302 (-) Transcript_14237:244-1149(-)|eukprot:CAMPEP_0177628266 /NCGR_PEP_ID=MMETSP0447-20121125/40_1 /TAXON_ID=0 /ORGANISM="Stygamoeba regulata, Strain BSH-02190019" /LENGTH=301 /DNA_ID=CAMNT_0019129503 /DNA_START=16 /DNA_END=921 /DNA_ORIENTATION=-
MQEGKEDWFDVDGEKALKEDRSGLLESGLGGQIAAQLAGTVYARTKQDAASFVNFYARVDYFRPYFDVDLPTVLKRIVLSLVPFPRNVPKEELYGPLMILFTLIFVLQMLMSGEEKEILMGIAFGTCASFTVFNLLSVHLLNYLFGSECNFIQLLFFLGYSYFGLCLSLVLRFVLWLAHQTALPTTQLAAAIVLASGTSLALSLYRTTPKRNLGAAVGLYAALLYFGFALYLHSLVHLPHDAAGPAPSVPADPVIEAPSLAHAANDAPAEAPADAPADVPADAPVDAISDAPADVPTGKGA